MKKIDLVLGVLLTLLVFLFGFWLGNNYQIQSDGETLSSIEIKRIEDLYKKRYGEMLIQYAGKKAIQAVSDKINSDAMASVGNIFTNEGKETPGSNISHFINVNDTPEKITAALRNCAKENQEHGIVIGKAQAWAECFDDLRIVFYSTTADVKKTGGAEKGKPM